MCGRQLLPSHVLTGSQCEEEAAGVKMLMILAKARNTQVLRRHYKCVLPRRLPTIVGEAGGSDDGHCHHDQPAATPHVLHEELLDHDVPQTLGQDQVHLVRQSPVALLQLAHLHLQIRSVFQKIKNILFHRTLGMQTLLLPEISVVTSLFRSFS